MARSSSRPDKVYPSKIDVWVLAIIILVLAALAIGMIMAVIAGDLMHMAQRFFVTLGVAGLIVWIMIGTNYTLHGRDLIVRSGPMRWTIAVDQITAIEPATGFFRARASPALSFDRLAVSYGKGRRVLISPADQDAFLKEVASRGGTV